MVAFSCNSRYIADTDREKLTKYGPLQAELMRTNLGRKVTVLPIVIGNTGAVTATCTRSIDELNSGGCQLFLPSLHKIALTATAKIAKALTQGDGGDARKRRTNRRGGGRQA